MQVVKCFELDFPYLLKGRFIAHADEDVAIRLRVAILCIYDFPRGARNIREYFNKWLQVTRLKPVIPEIISELLQEHAFSAINKYFDRDPPFQLEEVMLSGSISEGTLKLNFKVETVSDWDFMLVLENILVTEAEQKKGNLRVKENTPFVNLYLTDPDLLKTWSEFLDISIKPKYERTKLSSRKLKERFRENYITDVPFAAPLNDEDVKLVGEGPSIEVCSKTPSNEKVKDVKSFLKNFPKNEFDFVLAIKCNGWPLCAQEWIFRPRCWPSQDLVQKIVKEGFHIVCKSSPEGDFRLSYSNAETLLIGNLTDFQFKTYRAFKSFVSHYKKNWSDNAKRAVYSYHLKTIVLWYCEKSDPIDWTEERVVDHLLSLIDDLIFAIKEKKLPMYFMPKYNLLERLEDTTEAVEQMTALRLNLNLITKGIISEEPNFLDALNYVWNFYSDEALQTISAMADTQWKPGYFRDVLSKAVEIVDKFWKSARGKIPDREDIQGHERAEKLIPPFEKALENLCKGYNLQNILPESLQVFFDEMNTSIAEINNLIKDGEGWHEFLFTLYNRRRNLRKHTFFSRESITNNRN